MKRILLWTLVFGVVTPANTRAQMTLPSIPSAISLELAIELAYRYSPVIRQVQNDLSGASWRVRNAYAAFLPNVSVDGGIGYSGAGSQRFLTQQFEQRSGTLGSSYGLNLSLRLDGRTLMQPGLSGAQRDATEAAIRGSEINLESSVRQQYLGVKEAEAQLALAQLQLTRNREFLRLAQARFDVGQNTLLDVRRAEVEQGQAEVGLLRAEHEVTVQKLGLFQLMGVPAPEDISAITLPDTFAIVTPDWRLTDLLGEADRDNPDLLALRAQHTSARAGERAAKSTWLPSLSLSAGWSRFTQQFTNSDFLIAQAEQGALGAQAECSFAKANFENAGAPNPLDCSALAWDPAQGDLIRQQNQVFPFNFTAQPFRASLSVSLPIFTQFGRPLEIAEASARTDDASEQVRERELLVRTDVSRAYYTLLAAHETITIQERNRGAAQEGLRLATERYRVGSGTFFELLDAQLAAEQAEAEYVSAVYAYHRSIAALEAAVGRPLR